MILNVNKYYLCPFCNPKSFSMPIDTSQRELKQNKNKVSMTALHLIDQHFNILLNLWNPLSHDGKNLRDRSLWSTTKWRNIIGFLTLMNDFTLFTICSIVTCDSTGKCETSTLAQGVEMSVTTNSPSKHSFHPHNQITYLSIYFYSFDNMRF